jgi:hypothetical protein
MDLCQEWPKVEGLVKQQVAAFRRAHGWDWHELLSDGFWHFVQALKTWEEGKGQSLSTWVASNVRWGLLSRLRAKRPGPLPDGLAERAEFDLTAELGDDAKLLLKLLTEQPRDVGLLAGTADGRVLPWKVLGAAVCVLREAGWCSARIAESLREIREVL